MNKKKGFTLIELLAIIVILAIIAVITVPLILGIIDNAKEKTTIASAYGFKDAVEKDYTKNLLSIDNQKLNGTYMISNGKINNQEISISGTKPSNGELKYQNNRLVSGCLTIDGYKVEYKNEKFNVSGKGDCNVIMCGENEYEDFSDELFYFNDKNACKSFFIELASNNGNCIDSEECLNQIESICNNEIPQANLLEIIYSSNINLDDIKPFTKINEYTVTDEDNCKSFYESNITNCKDCSERIENTCKGNSQIDLMTSIDSLYLRGTREIPNRKMLNDLKTFVDQNNKICKPETSFYSYQNGYTEALDSPNLLWTYWIKDSNESLEICVYKNDRPYCIKANNHEKNIIELNNGFDNCTENIDEQYYKCYGPKNYQDFSIYDITSYANGKVEFNYPGRGSCTIDSNNNLECWDLLY